MKKILFFILMLVSVSCEDMFEPAIENHKSLEDMYSNPSYAYGVLLNAYVQLPFYTSPTTTDVATDDAVINDTGSNYRKMAEGLWSSTSSPIDKWRNCNNSIQSINVFLENTDKCEWAKDPLVNELFLDRTRGEAYALRALHLYYLIRIHGGYDESGELLGVPILTESQTVSSEFNVPRNTLKECVDQIFSDIDKALEYLPMDYEVHDYSDVPQKYKDMGMTNADKYNRVFGQEFQGLVSGRIAKIIKSQVALWAASPAYLNDGEITYKMAADMAGEMLSDIGGVDGIDPTGATWYRNEDDIENLPQGENPREIIWRGTKSNPNNDLEKDLFPPTLYGKGRVNPSQSLVDAFGMKNGYPIAMSDEGGYSSSSPYSNRDPRLNQYIIYNGATMGQGENAKAIFTAADGTTDDALNKQSGFSTRTGYYLRKFTREYVSIDPNNTTPRKRYTAFLRYTEIFLNYAEASNEAYGPTGSGDKADFSAYDVIKALRERGGIDASDPYLESIKSDKDKMRELIRNERRIELCFENQRFWDLRRWKVSIDELNTPVMGISILGDTYNAIEVETRNYEDYMYYSPLPYSEIQKYSNLSQNRGW